jgi:hypothetical protein
MLEKRAKKTTKATDEKQEREEGEQHEFARDTTPHLTTPTKRKKHIPAGIPLALRKKTTISN